MKLRWMPVVASLVGMFFCASVAQAQSVYVHNKPLAHAADVGGTVYVPFNELMKSLNCGWNISDGVVKVNTNGFDGPTLFLDSFCLQVGGKSVDVKGLMRDDQVWVPVRLARELGCEVNYNKATQIIDVVAPRLISDSDRAAQAEVDKARAEKESKLAEEQEQQRLALEERKKQMAALKATKSSGMSADPDAEGSLPSEFAAGASGGVETYEDLINVQKQLDKEAFERRQAADAAEDGAGATDTKAEKAAPAPEPNVVVFAPQAIPDYFTGHITLRATVKNIGDAEAKGLRATLTVVGPDGSVWNTQNLTCSSVAAGGQWNIESGYDHIAGSEMPRGNVILKVNVDYSNKPAKK